LTQRREGDLEGVGRLVDGAEHDFAGAVIVANRDAGYTRSVVHVDHALHGVGRNAAALVLRFERGHPIIDIGC
jgi:hypothetical protein